MTPLLSLDSLDICFNKQLVAQDISFSLRSGEILGVIGESGSGKSTILKAIMNLLGGNGRVSKGHIWFEGQDIVALPVDVRRKINGAKITMVFQDSRLSLCPVRSIGSQIHEVFLAHTSHSRKHSDAMALEVFSTLAFKDPLRILNSYPFELSGGMIQRVGIGMAMLLQPSLILADEPTSALDVAVQKEIIHQFMHLKERYKTAIVFVSHNIKLIEKISDAVMVLKDGRVVEYGPCDRVFKAPQDAYTKTLLAAAPVLRRH